MSRLIHTWFVVAALSLWVTKSAMAQNATNVVKSLTRQECIVRALQNNLEIKSQQIKPTIASWGVVGAQGVYDPTLSGSVNYQDETLPRDTTQVFTNALTQTTVTSRTLQPTLSLGGKLPTGAIYDFAATDTRFAGNAVSNYLYTGNASVNLTQPLLKNFGLGINSANIRVARKDQKIAQQSFIQFVMNKVAEVSTAYYELVFAIEDHKAKRETLTEFQEFLDQTRKRVQIGTASPLDIIQAEAGVAENEQAVINSEQLIRTTGNNLRRLISQQVTEFLGVTLVPTDFPIAQMMALDVNESIRNALQMRPDYRAACEAVERQNIVVQFNRNQLWPEIDLQGSYGANGRGTTWDNFSDNLTSGDNPVWSAGVVVTLPLGNRQARANYNISKLDADQVLLNLKGLEQDIIVAVDTAVGRVESTAKSVEAARAAARSSEASLDAEKKKLQAGTSTTFLVLQAQSQLGESRSAEVRARAFYAEALVDLDLAEGTILQKNNVILAEAKP